MFFYFDSKNHCFVMNWKHKCTNSGIYSVNFASFLIVYFCITFCLDLFINSVHFTLFSSFLVSKFLICFHIDSMFWYKTFVNKIKLDSVQNWNKQLCNLTDNNNDFCFHCSTSELIFGNLCVFAKRMTTLTIIWEYYRPVETPWMRYRARFNHRNEIRLICITGFLVYAASWFFSIFQILLVQKLVRLSELIFLW